MEEGRDGDDGFEETERKFGIRKERTTTRQFSSQRVILGGPQSFSLREVSPPQMTKKVD